MSRDHILLFPTKHQSSEAKSRVGVIGKPTVTQKRQVKPTTTRNGSRVLGLGFQPRGMDLI